jgi:hypothetical protein
MVAGGHHPGRPLVLLVHGRNDENGKVFIDRHQPHDVSRWRKWVRVPSFSGFEINERLATEFAFEQ